jgi:phospholipase C
MPLVDVHDPVEAERLEALAPEAFHTRRDFLQRTAVTAGLAAGMGLMLDPNTVVAEAARRQRRAQLPSPRNLPIDTFVVLMMENRSFDHYLGWLPGADGRQAGLQFTDTHGKTYATHRLANNYQGCGFLDPDHSWDGGRTEMDRGRMDGFLKAASDVFSIGYYAEPDLPFMPHVAKAYTAFDRFFCSILSSTYPNREYMHAAQSYGMKDNTLPNPSFPDTTIFAALSKAGVSNHYYYTDLPVSAFWGAPGIARFRPFHSWTPRSTARTRGPRVTSIRTATSALARRSSPMSSMRSWSLPNTRPERCSSSTTSGAVSSTTLSLPAYLTCGRAPTS